MINAILEVSMIYFENQNERTVGEDRFWGWLGNTMEKMAFAQNLNICVEVNQVDLGAKGCGFKLGRTGSITNRKLMRNSSFFYLNVF